MQDCELHAIHIRTNLNLYILFYFIFYILFIFYKFSYIN